MKKFYLPLLLAYCWTISLSAQIAFCTDPLLNTYSLVYMPEVDDLHTRFATNAIQNEAGEYVTIGLTRSDFSLPDAYRMFFARFDSVGNWLSPAVLVSIFDNGELNFYFDGIHSPIHLIEACDPGGDCDGYYVLATVRSDPAVTDDEDTDVILMRLDKEGCVLWVEQFLQFEPNSEFARGLFRLEDGDLACFIQKTHANTGVPTLNVVRVSADGLNCSFSADYNATSDPFTFFNFEPLTVTELSALPNPDARFAVAGLSRDEDGRPWLSLLTLDHNFDVIGTVALLHDLDALPATDEIPRDIEQDGPYVLITGSKLSETAISPVPIRRGFVLKTELFDANGALAGNIQWIREYDLPPAFNILEEDRFRGLEVTEDGYTISGYSFFEENLATSFLMKTDFEGVPVWINRYEEEELSLSGVSDLRLVADGGYLMSGARWLEPQAGPNGIWLAKTDPDGNFFSCECFFPSDVITEPIFPEITGFEVLPDPQDCIPDFLQGDCTSWDDVVVYCDQHTGEDCLAAFSFSPLDSCGTIQFQNASVGSSPISYEWSFGDTNGSTAINPAYTYAMPGNYEVCLFLAAADGCKDTLCQIIEVEFDDSPPELVCPGDITIYTDYDDCINSTFDDLPVEVINSPCSGPASVACSQLNPPWPLGTTVVFCETINDFGKDSCSFKVTVLDTIPPQISCPPDTCVTVPAGEGGAYVGFDIPLGSDNCPFTVECSHASGDFFPLGTTLVTCTAMDYSLNTDSCSFTITVKEEELPPDCWEADSITVNCAPDDFTKYNVGFRLRHFGNFLADEALLYNLPAGFHFVQGGMPFGFLSVDIFPPVPAGVYTDPLDIMIVADEAVSMPTEVCFQVRPSGTNPDGFWECCYSDSLLCVVLEPCCDPCEEIGLSVDTSGQDSCCFSLDLDNLCPLAEFTKIETEILTPGVTFGSHAFGGPTASDWNNPLVLDSLILWAHSSGFIPNGSFENLLNFCLDNITSNNQIPQKIVVRYFEATVTGQEALACTDTLYFDCPLTDFPCVALTDYEVSCTDVDGTFDFNFTFTNISDHSADFLDISVVSPAGVSLVPDGVLLSSPLLPGSSASTDIDIVGGIPGSVVTLQMRLEDLTSGDGWCCLESDTFAIQLPLCDDACGPCEDNLLRNAGFEIAFPDPAQDWIDPSGMIAGTPGATNNLFCSGAWSMQMKATEDTEETIVQDLMDNTLIEGKKYRVRFCGWSEDPDVRFRIRAANSIIGDGSCPAGDCETIGVSDVLTDEWLCYELPVYTAGSDYAYFIVSAETVDGALVGWAYIDDICLEEEDPLPPVSDITAIAFPNPVSGNLSVVLNTPAVQEMEVSLTDLLGRRLREEILPVGADQLSMDTRNLPAGVYILQLMMNGKEIMKEKIVKQ